MFYLILSDYNILQATLGLRTHLNRACWNLQPIFMAQPWTTFLREPQPSISPKQIAQESWHHVVWKLKLGRVEKATIGLGNPNKIPGLVLDYQGSSIPHLPGEGC